MDLIYTDKNRIELGCLHNFDVDFDTTSTKDFEIKTDIKNDSLKGKYFWYIPGTEYGGRIDKVTVDTDSNAITYHGRNFRGLLCSKIIEPPTGQDYKILSGTVHDIVYRLICDASLQDMYTVDACDVVVKQYKFFRYVNVYDGIISLTQRFGLVPIFTVTEEGKVNISFSTPTDNSDDSEFTQDDLSFSISKVYNDVNHLICLGKGELKDRAVVHLYVDSEGNISDIQTMFGPDEITEKYENTNADNVEVLKSEGIEKLKELRDTDSFEVTVPDISLKIGDIVGGVERITGVYVASEITNAIVKIDDDTISVEYKVGQDNTSSGSTQAGTTTAVSFGMGVDEEGDLYIYHDDGDTVPTFEYDSDSGSLYVSDTTRQFEFDEATGNLYEIRS